MEKLKIYLLARLEEPTTYAGGGVLATMIMAVLPEHLGSAILGAMAAIGALLAIILPEKKSTVVQPIETIIAENPTKRNRVTLGPGAA